MAERVIPQKAIQKRIEEIDARLADLATLQRHRALLIELLKDAIEIELPEPQGKATLTDQIVATIKASPGHKSGVIADHLVKVGSASNPKVVQTIIGQLANRADGPIIRKDDGALYPRPTSEFEDFPAALQDEDDDLPF